MLATTTRGVMVLVCMLSDNIKDQPANCVGSSRLKPEMRSDVSNKSQIKSLTVLSDLSAEAFFLSSVMIPKKRIGTCMMQNGTRSTLNNNEHGTCGLPFSGLISIVFLDTI